jgi:hypothetical protein
LNPGGINKKIRFCFFTNASAAQGMVAETPKCVGLWADGVAADSPTPCVAWGCAQNLIIFDFCHILFYHLSFLAAFE